MFTLNSWEEWGTGKRINCSRPQSYCGHSQALKPRDLSTCSRHHAMMPSMYLILSSINLGLIPCRIHVANSWVLKMWFSLMEKDLRQSDNLWGWPWTMEVPARLSVTFFPKKDATFVFILFFNHDLYHVFPSVQCIRYVLKTFGCLKFWMVLWDVFS